MTLRSCGSDATPSFHWRPEVVDEAVTISPGTMAVLLVDAQMRPSRIDPSQRPHARSITAGRGDILIVLSLAPRRGTDMQVVEVLTPNGETGWIYTRHLET